MRCKYTDFCSMGYRVRKEDAKGTDGITRESINLERIKWLHSRQEEHIFDFALSNRPAIIHFIKNNLREK